MDRKRSGLSLFVMNTLARLSAYACRATDSMEQAEGLIKEKVRSIKPAQCSPHPRNMILLALTRNHPGSEIQKFLEAMKIGCRSRTVYNEAISDVEVTISVRISDGRKWRIWERLTRMPQHLRETLQAVAKKVISKRTES